MLKLPKRLAIIGVVRCLANIVQARGRQQGFDSPKTFSLLVECQKVNGRLALLPTIMFQQHRVKIARQPSRSLNISIGTTSSCHIDADLREIALNEQGEALPERKILGNQTSEVQVWLRAFPELDALVSATADSRMAAALAGS